ncbi:hypothetical protein A0H81_03528 [Grifola frondosa]|uniref:Uncharacterized protein n=1 Tax=Grifola frondosa TaxID=5627 RepID=A0A1C7MK29_GRIFR|nr:hypothetical protein A0H81_03528 [Grifola frondosa]
MIVDAGDGGFIDVGVAVRWVEKKGNDSASMCTGRPIPNLTPMLPRPHSNESFSRKLYTHMCFTSSIIRPAVQPALRLDSAYQYHNVFMSTTIASKHGAHLERSVCFGVRATRVCVQDSRSIKLMRHSPRTHSVCTGVASLPHEVAQASGSGSGAPLSKRSPLPWSFLTVSRIPEDSDTATTRTVRWRISYVVGQ